MAAYRRVYDSRHLQADCKEPESTPEPYMLGNGVGYFYLFTFYRPVYDSRHLQTDCQEPGSAQEPYAGQSSMGYLYIFA